MNGKQRNDYNFYITCKFYYVYYIYNYKLHTVNKRLKHLFLHEPTNGFIK